MNMILIIELLFSLIALTCALIFFAFIFQNDNIDCDKWVVFYRKQKDKVLKEIIEGNKKIDEIEKDIKKYRKGYKDKKSIGFIR